MRIVGLTGGIACGKTTIAERLRHKGVAVVDADAIARRVLEPGTAAYRKVVALAGEAVLADDWHGAAGARPLDRKKVRQYFFARPELKRQLERLTHPATLRLMLLELAGHFFRCAPLVLLDVPLLIEAGLHRFCSDVVVVALEPDVQLQRLQRRDASLRDNADEARQLIAAQMPLDQKIARATVVIDNNATVERLHQLVDDLYERKLRPTAARRIVAVAIVVASLLVPVGWLVLLVSCCLQ